MIPRRAAPEADATRDLYERYARQIQTYCLHQLGNREEAEDAVQSTFLNAFRGFQRGVDPEFESAWLYKIAQNVCLTRQRSSSRRRKIETASDLDAMQDYVPAHEVDLDELINLPEALDAMPHQQRKALLLREWQGLSYKEIADELGLSQAAVETLLFRARRSLAAGLSEEPAKKGALQRLRTGGDVGSGLAILKSLLFTGGAKVMATVATVAATSVMATTPAARHVVENVVTPPLHHRHARPHQIARTPGSGGTPAPSRYVAPSRPAVTGPSAPAVVTASRAWAVHRGDAMRTDAEARRAPAGHAPVVGDSAPQSPAAPDPVPTAEASATTATASASDVPAATPAPTPTFLPVAKSGNPKPGGNHGSSPQSIPTTTQPPAATSMFTVPASPVPKKDDANHGNGNKDNGNPKKSPPASSNVTVASPDTTTMTTAVTTSAAPPPTTALEQSVTVQQPATPDAGKDKGPKDNANGGGNGNGNHK